MLPSIMFEHKLRIEHATVDDALRWKKQAEELHLVSGNDFIWSYYPSNMDGWTQLDPKAVEFCFDNAAWVTFFSLKWVK